MSERLYQPDFSSIFGENHANAFSYGRVDTLVWPVFSDVKKSQNLENLLKLKNKEGHPLFYRRNVSIKDELVELNCANMDLALIQAMSIERDYGITNEDVLSAVEKEPNRFRGVLSFSLKSGEDVTSNINSAEKRIPLAGIVVYPSYSDLDLLDSSNQGITQLLELSVKKNYFIKIDVGNIFLPDNHASKTSPRVLKEFLSKHPEPTFILSGLDIYGDFNNYYSLLKYFNNLWIELEPRSFGGMTPRDCFRRAFDMKGFIQNCWHRMMIGSATPTLEVSQIVRGFLEATSELSFSQKNLLRTWGLRNVNRINRDVFPPLKAEDVSLYKPIQEVKEQLVIQNDHEVTKVYKVKLRSYSITQLIFLTDLVQNIVERTLNTDSNLEHGELLMRSYHTTTSLLVNEHEFGNYLDLHYMLADQSAKDSSPYLHTVNALENRADFNHFDHELASTYGSRQLIIPILDGHLEMGGRENFYVLVTFGPRTFHLLFRVKLYKK